MKLEDLTLKELVIGLRSILGLQEDAPKKNKKDSVDDDTPIDINPGKDDDENAPTTGSGNNNTSNNSNKGKDKKNIK